jgi:hypothetical protein
MEQLCDDLSPSDVKFFRSKSDIPQLCLSHGLNALVRDTMKTVR